MANDDTTEKLLAIAHTHLAEAQKISQYPASEKTTGENALTSIAASLLVLAEKEADRDERKEHHVH
jgi:hypothetical protein